MPGDGSCGSSMAPADRARHPQSLVAPSRRLGFTGHVDLSTALVVFDCSPAQAAEIDVTTGPCVPRTGPKGGRRRTLVSPHSQWYSDTLDHLRRLYVVLGGPAEEEPLSDVRSDGPGTIAALRDDFVDRLAAITEKPQWIEAGERWLTAAQWPPTMKAQGLNSRLVYRALLRGAQDSEVWRCTAGEGLRFPST